MFFCEKVKFRMNTVHFAIQAQRESASERERTCLRHLCRLVFARNISDGASKKQRSLRGTEISMECVQKTFNADVVFEAAKGTKN